MKTKTLTKTSVAVKSNNTLNFPALDIPRSLGREVEISK